MTQATLPTQDPTPPVHDAQGYVTYEQYLDDEARTYPERSEWIDGRVVALPMITDQHDATSQWLSELLGPYIRRKGGRLCREPFNMKTGPELPGRSPDLLIVTAEHVDRLEAKCLRGPAELVIEIVSRRYRTVDLVHKRAEYEQGGVPEYWIIDPEFEQAHFNQLDAAGKYQQIAPGSQGRYQSRVLPEVWLEPAWLWSQSPPDPIDVLGQWQAQ